MPNFEEEVRAQLKAIEARLPNARMLQGGGRQVLRFQAHDLGEIPAGSATQRAFRTWFDARYSTKGLIAIHSNLAAAVRCNVFTALQTETMNQTPEFTGRAIIIPAGKTTIIHLDLQEEWMPFYNVWFTTLGATTGRLAAVAHSLDIVEEGARP